jgi:Mrp family chromosome partitioning ATPase
VGKSTVAVNLAASLASEGKRVGLMEIDLHGPSISSLVNIVQRPGQSAEGEIVPAQAAEGLKVMSVGHLLPQQDEAVIWRGPMKHGVIRQFLSEVAWGPLDYLIVDSPPGTGDEPLSITQLIKDLDGAVIVTTPQAVALNDVKRSISFCRRMKLNVIGVVENMSGFICPECGKESDIFKRGGGEAMAGQMGECFLGSIPLDPEVVRACDAGIPFVRQNLETRTALAIQKVMHQILDKIPRKEKHEDCHSHR